MQPTDVQEPLKPEETGQLTQSPKQKMSEKEKGFMWTGIFIVLLVVLYAIFFIVVPHIYAQINNCELLAMGGNNCNTTAGGMAIYGILGSSFVGIPLLLIGSTFILYAILSWKKVKNPGLTAFLSMLLGAALLALLVFGLIFFLTTGSPSPRPASLIFHIR